MAGSYPREAACEAVRVGLAAWGKVTKLVVVRAVLVFGGTPSSARVAILATVAWTPRILRGAAWTIAAEHAGVAESVLVVTPRMLSLVIEAIHPRVGLPGAPGASAPV